MENLHFPYVVENKGDGTLDAIQCLRYSEPRKALPRTRVTPSTLNAANSQNLQGKHTYMSRTKSPDHKEPWPTIAARIDPILYAKLKQKHPNYKEISNVIRILMQKYMDGRILGVVAKMV